VKTRHLEEVREHWKALLAQLRDPSIRVKARSAIPIKVAA